MAVLAVDIGGTKTLAALVHGGHLVDTRTFPTDREGTPDLWLETLKEAVSDWQGRYGGIGLAVTGRVSEGLWSALNPGTLNIDGAYPLAERARALFGFEPVLANDAQAAAYGEFAHGAGGGEDMVFLTVSTGIGGGVVANGRLLSGAAGLAGHFGQMRGLDRTRLEDSLSGRAIERQARALGHDLSVPAIFAQAQDGAGWAEDLLDASARGVAALCADIKLTFDPVRIVIGGGVGLAPGYLERISNHLDGLRSEIRPALCRAALGASAGVLGIAALFDATET